MIIGQYDEKTATVTLVVKGHFDYSCQQEFREAFTHYPKGYGYIVDLHGVGYIDSSALGMLLLLRDYAGGDDSNIAIKGASEFVTTALKMARFERLFALG